MRRVHRSCSLLCLGALMLLPGCTAKHASRSTSTTVRPSGLVTTTSAGSASGTAPRATTSARAPTTNPSQSLAALVAKLRQAAFDGSQLPKGLHVTGVGPVEADPNPPNRIGSAQVIVRSDAPGERILTKYE